MVNINIIQPGMRVKRIALGKQLRNCEYDDYARIPIGATGTILEYENDISEYDDWDYRSVFVSWDKPVIGKNGLEVTYSSGEHDANHCWRIHPLALELLDYNPMSEIIKKIKYLDKRFLEKKHVKI